MSPMSECGQNLNVPNVLVNLPNLPNVPKVPKWLNLNVPNVLINVSNLPNVPKVKKWPKSECAQYAHESPQSPQCTQSPKVAKT